MNWQPIDTAPRDGTRILVSGYDYGHRGGVPPQRVMYLLHWDKDCWRTDSRHIETFNKETHWHPLPELPA